MKQRAQGHLSEGVIMGRFVPPSPRSLLEVVVATMAGVSAVLAVIWPTWIEALGIDPDRGSGSLEWAIPGVLAVTAILVGMLAQRHWRLDAPAALER